MEQEKRLLFGTTLKYLTTFDMAIIKLAIMVFVLFFISVCPLFANWVINTHWAWFLIVWIILLIPSVKKVWKK
jgi:hypothetical protein